MIIGAENKLNNIYLGDGLITKVYHGNDVVYERSTPDFDSKNYQKVEYIQSRNNVKQYIDTGITQKDGQRIHIRFRAIFNVNTETGRYMFGTSDTKNSVAGAFMLEGLTYAGRVNLMTAFYTSNLSTMIAISANTDFDLFWETEGNNRRITSNLANVTAKTGNISGKHEYKNIYLFNINWNTETRSYPIRLYEYQVYENEILVQNLIPCYRKSDSTAGLYDTVTKQFLENQGENTFVLGPDVE